jgi:hypothetical protein
MDGRGGDHQPYGTLNTAGFLKLQPQPGRFDLKTFNCIVFNNYNKYNAMQRF